MKLPGVGFSSTLTLISVSRSSITHSLRVDRQEMLRQVDAQVNFPNADGLQHDERKVGFPVLTEWLRFTWQGNRRKIDDPTVSHKERCSSRWITHQASTGICRLGLPSHEGVVGWH